MDNQEMTLRSPNGKQYVDIKRDENFSSNPRNDETIGYVYIKPLLDSRMDVYQFADEGISDIIKIFDDRDCNAFSDEELEAGEHILFMDEINRTAMVKLPIFIKVKEYGEAEIKTDQFYGSVLCGYIFTTEESVLKYEDENDARFSLEEQKKMLHQEVRDYNNFLSGNVWSYTLHDVIPDDAGDYSRQNDSIFGIFGDYAIDTILADLDAKDWVIESQENEREKKESPGR